MGNLTPNLGLILLASAVVFAAGCDGGGSGGSDDNSPTTDASGTWVLALTNRTSTDVGDRRAHERRAREIEPVQRGRPRRPTGW